MKSEDIIIVNPFSNWFCIPCFNQKYFWDGADNLIVLKKISFTKVLANKLTARQ